MEVGRLMTSLYYFYPHMSFWSCLKSPNNKQNKYKKMCPSTEGVKGEITPLRTQQCIFLSSEDTPGKNKAYVVTGSCFVVNVLFCVLWVVWWLRGTECKRTRSRRRRRRRSKLVWLWWWGEEGMVVVSEFSAPGFVTDCVWLCEWLNAWLCFTDRLTDWLSGCMCEWM